MKTTGRNGNINPVAEGELVVEVINGEVVGATTRIGQTIQRGNGITIATLETNAQAIATGEAGVKVQPRPSRNAGAGLTRQRIDNSFKTIEIRKENHQ